MPNNNNNNRRRNNNNKQPGAVPTLDLHGLRREPAIRRLTDFLEAQQKQSRRVDDEVLVITGAGNHSGATGGPVLRGAVEDLLRRRQMEFYRETPGSLRVKCQTGITFYSNDNNNVVSDTKVVLDEADSDAMRLATARQRKSRTTIHQQHANRPGGSSQRGGAAAAGGASSLFAPGENPSLAQVAREEKDLEQGKKASLELERQRCSKESLARNEYHRAVNLSLDEERQEEQRQQELIQKAVALSEQQQTEEEKSEREMLEQALALSQQEAHQSTNDLEQQEEKERELLEEALALSQQEAVSEREQAEQRERELLQQVLELSKQEEESQKENEDRLLQQVLRSSMSQQIHHHHDVTAQEQADLQAAFEQSLNLSTVDKQQQQQRL